MYAFVYQFVYVLSNEIEAGRKRKKKKIQIITEPYVHIGQGENPREGEREIAR